MHDCHTFSRLVGSTLEEIVEHANKIREESPCGMLCPVVLLRGNKELRRVGTSAHDRGGHDPKYWDVGVKKWLEECYADNALVTLVAKGRIEK